MLFDACLVLLFLSNNRLHWHIAAAATSTKQVCDDIRKFIRNWIQIILYHKILIYLIDYIKIYNPLIQLIDPRTVLPP